MANIPAPLSTARVSGYDFGDPMPADGWTGTGESFGWLKHLGSDIGTKAGEPIVASFPGVAKFQSGVPGYGNLLTETFDNGWKFLFGHVAGGVSGPVAAGQRIGTTGANVGSSKGAVTLFQILNPKGVAVNPDPTLKALVSGSSAGLGSVFGSGAQAASGFSDPFAIGAGIASAGGDLAGSISAIPTQVGHGLADFFVVAEQDIAEWFGRQAIAFFVAAVVLLVLFL